MLDYLIKFNQLPKELRDQVSSPEIVTAISELEQKYQLSLAGLIMKIMIKELPLSESTNFLITDYKLTEVQAKSLGIELQEKIFKGLAEYLGLQKPTEASNHQELIRQEKPGLPNLVKKSETELEVLELAQELKAFTAVRVEPKLVPSEYHPEINQEHLEAVEIKKLTEQINNSEFPANQLNREAELDRIIKLAQINFSSQLLVDRFRQILSTYLRGIRGKIDTKAALAKPFAAGGLSFDNGSVDKVISLIDSLNNPGLATKTSLPKKIILPEDSLEALKAVGVRDVEYDLAKALAQKKANNEVPTELSEVKSVAPLSLKNLAETIQPVSEALDKSLTVGMEKIIFRRPPDVGNKIKIEDVKAIPKTMGPVDEIKYMDLVNFRRLDKDPVRAVLKIKEKINFLESEQYSLRFLAIKAWRQSVINHLYLAIGEEAITNKQSVEQVIANNLKKDAGYLNNSEFEAIMSLNKDLRF